MLYYLLSEKITFPLLGTLLNFVYYGLIYTGLAVSSILIYKKLRGIGYPKKKTQLFVMLVFLISFPAGIISSRAANMFYHPVKQWSLHFFVEQFLHGNHQTFHASLILPVLLISGLIVLIKLKLWGCWDSIFLHIPLAHAIGRTGCFLVGCCWGNDICINLAGVEFTFANPVPLYAIFINSILFLFLNKVFGRTYGATSGFKPPEGSIVMLYLVLYGLTRLCIELIRIEKIVAFSMTQAQIAMVCFIITGTVILLRMIYNQKNTTKADHGIIVNKQKE